MFMSINRLINVSWICAMQYRIVSSREKTTNKRQPTMTTNWLNRNIVFALLTWYTDRSCQNTYTLPFYLFFKISPQHPIVVQCAHSFVILYYTSKNRTNVNYSMCAQLISRLYIRHIWYDSRWYLSSKYAWSKMRAQFQPIYTYTNQPLGFFCFKID